LFQVPFSKTYKEFASVLLILFIGVEVLIVVVVVAFSVFFNSNTAAITIKKTIVTRVFLLFLIRKASYK